ncbi:MAG TPA: hypothetical protein VMZ52_12295 [Bryobacteraceae bacterium]|nr:hypothetical protein [Bryobacteraceae bacterium]
MYKLSKSVAACFYVLAFSVAAPAAPKSPPKFDTPAQAFLSKWHLDKKKTQNVAGAPGNLMQELKMKDGKLLVKSQYDQPQDGIYPLIWLGIMVEEFTLNPDGSENVNDIGPFRHVGKTTVNGNTMTTDWNATIENGTVAGQWVRTLSANGKEMTLQVTGKASDGRTVDSTLVFQKK